MIHILEGENAVDYCRANIEALVDIIAVNASVMLQKGSFTNIEQIHISKQIIKLFSLIYEDGNLGFYNRRVVKWSMRIAKCYACSRDAEKTVYWLEKAITHAVAYDKLSEGTYTSLLVSGLKYNAVEGKCTQLDIVQRELLESSFDFVRRDRRFIGLLRSVC